MFQFAIFFVAFAVVRGIKNVYTRQDVDAMNSSAFKIAFQEVKRDEIIEQIEKVALRTSNALIEKMEEINAIVRKMVQDLKLINPNYEVDFPLALLNNTTTNIFEGII